MNSIIRQAQRLTQQDVAEAHKRRNLPIPRSQGDVYLERKIERDLEKDAPSTGYPDLDKIIKGFIPGHLYTVTGSENTGKTSLCCNFAVRVAKQRRKILYFALEPENAVLDYLASVRTGKRFDELTDKDLQHDDEYISIYGKQEVPTLEQLVEIVTLSEVQYDLIIIDHIGYFIMGTQNYIQEQSNAVKALAGLAKERKTAILLIAHLRKRPSGQKRDYLPTSDDISGSGAFKQDSTEVMIVVREYVDPENDVAFSYDGKLVVTKTKCGPNGQIPVFFAERCANISTPGERLREIRDVKESLGFDEPAQAYPPKVVPTTPTRLEWG